MVMMQFTIRSKNSHPYSSTTAGPDRFASRYAPVHRCNAPSDGVNSHQTTRRPRLQRVIREQLMWSVIWNEPVRAKALTSTSSHRPTPRAANQNAQPIESSSIVSLGLIKWRIESCRFDCSSAIDTSMQKSRKRRVGYRRHRSSYDALAVIRSGDCSTLLPNPTVSKSMTV